MTEAYSIAARLQFTSNAPQVVADLIRSFERLDQIIGNAQANVGRLTAELRTLSTGGRGLNAAAKALERLGQTKMAPSLLGDMEKVTAASRQLAEAQAAIARSTAESAAAMGRMAAAAPRALRSGRGGTGGAGRASGGGGMSHGDLLNTGMALQMGGEAGLGVFGGALKAEMEVREQLAMLRMNNRVDDAEIEKARAVADRITKETPGTTLAENLHHVVDAFTIMGDLNEALKGAPAFARAAYLFKNIPGAHRGDTSFAAAQAIEVMQRHVGADGKVNMDAFNREMANMVQVAYGTGGRVDGSAYLAFAKQSRVGGMVANDQYLNRDLPALLIALGGSRAGTGDAAVWNQFVTGKMTANAFGALKDAGILDKSAEWQHGQVRDMEKHLVDAGGFGANRVQWIRDTFFGNDGVFARNHIDPHDKLAVSRFLSKWSSRQTGLGFLSEPALGMDNIDKEAGKIETTTRDPMSVLRQSDPSQAVREFRAAENNLMVALGKEALGPALEALKGLTQVVNDLAEFGKKHPDAAKNLTLVGGALSGLATGAGQAATVLFLGAPLLKGIGGLAGALSPFSPGAKAEVALATLAGSGAGSLGALAVAVVALPPLLKSAADALGLMGSEMAGHNTMGKRPEGGVTSPHPNSPWGMLGDWFNHLSEQHTNGTGGHGGGKGLSHHSSWTAPPGGGAPVQLRADLYLDNRKVGEIVGASLARDGSGPSGGATGFDGRAGYVGGMQMGAA